MTRDWLGPVAKVVVAFLVLIVVINEVVAFASAYWKAADIADKIVTEAQQTYEPGVLAGIEAEARQVAANEGAVLDWRVQPDKVKIIVKVKVKGTFLLHRLDMAKPYLEAKSEAEFPLTQR